MNRALCLQMFRLLTCLAITTLIIMPAQIVRGQGINGGSGYSYFGIGDIRESLGAAFEGMGGVGIAATSPYAINFSNPATWSFIRATRFQTGFTFRQHNNTVSKAGEQLSISQNNGEVQGFSAAFSIDTLLGITASLGVIPSTHVSFAFAAETSQAIFDYQGKGGLSEAYIGGAFRPIKNLAVGFSLRYLFGSRTESVNIYPNTPLSLAGSTQYIDNYQGVGLTLGAHYQMMENFTLGAILGFQSSLKVSQRTQYKFTSLPDTNETFSSETSMPLTAGFGIGYTKGRTSLFAEVVSKDYSSFSYRRQETKPGVSFQRSNRLSLGVSYAGNPDYNSSLFETLTYNVGFGYHQQYYVINGTGINEVYGSVGIGVPVTRRAIIDASATAGIRGSTDNGLFRELFARFSFSVNIGEIWFQPFFRE